MSSGNDVVIIGAGVIGCSIAYHLAQKGIRAQIVEREAIGARASGKAWAVIPYPAAFFLEENIARLSMSESNEEAFNFYAMPEGETIANWIELHWSSYYRFADLALDIREKTGIDIEYAESRNTFLFTSDELENMSKEAVISFVKGCGVYEYEWLDERDLKSSFPKINPKFAGGVSLPEFQVEPYKLTLGLGQAAENMGAEIKHGDVVGFGTDGGKITSVKLASGREIGADAVVIAMGPWSAQGASLLGRQLSLGIFMTECLRVIPSQEMPLHTISHRHCSIIPKIGGDAILASRSRMTRRDKDDFDSNLRSDLIEKTFNDVTDMLPDLEQAKVIEHRGDLLACAPEMPYNRPLMGRFPDWENAYIATQFGGLGICLSPGAGQIMADLIVDSQVPFRTRNMMERLSPAP